jgi:hypothetical protein
MNKASPKPDSIEPDEKLVILIREFKIKKIDDLVIAIRKSMLEKEVDHAKFNTEETIIWAFDNKEAVREEAVEKEVILPGEE